MTKGLERHVRNIMGNFAKFTENKYNRADYDASDITIDLQRAIYESKMSDRQASVVREIYQGNLTQEEAAVSLGLSQQLVLYHEKRAIELIAISLKKGRGTN